ncbi:uncharacterized protein PV09_06432 [Verruconis gallopava]|uniref:F-box domain-containing protein n=1 Tax=Verruconis gallopava TaxID=253628 RepID=A0A0D1YNI8_9PEZI|nr:uncharacterized protein PV09_06432 [Verruconis gallopava]KIW02282.1 hypothetical protein PV09_06432 [Verruconis gallopava]
MPRTLSVEEYKELGKTYYIRKDFDRALGAFTDGINASVGRDVQLYDYRAAVYDKLENVIAALSDARYMIKTFENDPRGYLRAGQLLLKMGKKEQALQIYARGLRFVPLSNPQLNLLRGAHDKLNRELRPPKAVDPFTQLPPEIIEIIMSYLRFYERVSCLRVSKQWNLFLASFPSLWTSMDLLRVGTRRVVKPSFINTCMRMAQNKITYARIANLSHRSILRSLTTSCPTLEKLEFVLSSLEAKSILEIVIPARSLKSLTIHADIEMNGDVMLKILKHRQTLEEFRVYNVTEGASPNHMYDFELPRLQVLDLRGVCPAFIQGQFASVLKKATNLRELVFEQQARPTAFILGRSMFKSLSKLEVLRINSASVVGLPRASIKLRELYYDCANRHIAPATEIPNGFPNLEKLRIGDMQCSLLPLLDPRHGNEGADLSEQSAMLKYLSIGCVSEAEWADIEALLFHARARELTELSLEGLAAAGLFDVNIESITHLRCLRSLSLDSAPITGIGIKELITSLKGTLKYLTLNACDAIGRDAVDWAARQGVSVTINEGGTRKKAARRR